jgi:signal transduction histidine kinase
MPPATHSWVSNTRKLLFAYLALCATVATTVGFYFYFDSAESYRNRKQEEKITALHLTEAFVSTYSNIRSQSLGGDAAPVPSHFRAMAIDFFSRTLRDSDVLRIQWLGVPGKEIRVAPEDPYLARSFNLLATSPDPAPTTEFLRVDGERVLRTIYPSMATQASCVECHNAVQDNRHKWQINQMMGAFVLEVSAEDSLIAFRNQAVLLAAGIWFATFFAGLFVSRQHARHERHSAYVISQLRDRDRALTAAKEAADTANHAKSEFLAMMSHELRTPLNAIIGFSNMISAEILGPVDKRYGAYAQDINASGQHLLHIIDDILDLSRAEANKLEMEVESINAAETIEAAIRLVRERADRAVVSIHVEIDPDLEVLADPLRLKQIVINLTANAVKFTPKGGRIDVAGKATPDGQFLLRIADTGIGMRAEDVPIVLKPFEKVRNSMVSASAGTGLGLPLTKRLAELHGGSLEIETAVGRGTVIYVTFGPNSVVRQPAREPALE